FPNRLPDSLPHRRPGSLPKIDTVQAVNRLHEEPDFQVLQLGYVALALPHFEIGPVLPFTRRKTEPRDSSAPSPFICAARPATATSIGRYQPAWRCSQMPQPRCTSRGRLSLLSR